MKRILALMLICTILSGCGATDPLTFNDGITFTDSMDRTVTVSDPQRVGICSGSLAECWLLAGGEITAVTRDAVTERNLELPENYMDLGSLKEPSAEAILTADLDLMILMSGLPNHVELAETLEKTGTAYAYFDVENFSDYLELMKIFTDITGRSDLYETNAASLQPQIGAAIESGKREDAPSVLILRTSSSRVKVLDSLLNAASEALCTFFQDIHMSYAAFRVGGLSTVQTSVLYPAATLITVLFIIVQLRANTLERLSLGDDTAFTLGVSVKKYRLLFLVCAAGMAGAAVSFAGLIGFLGLIVPHGARLVVGDEIKKLFPLSVLWGSLLLLVCDTVARTAFAPFELSVGIVISIIGAPIFIKMLLKRKVG